MRRTYCLNVWRACRSNSKTNRTTKQYKDVLHKTLERARGVNNWENKAVDRA